MNKLLDSLHKKILKSKFAEEVTEAEIAALVEAKENNCGWIPCSERLPDKSGWFLCTQEYHSLTNRKLIKVTTELVEFYDNKWRRTKNLVVTHWQPLPEPYQPKGE